MRRALLVPVLAMLLLAGVLVPVSAQADGQPPKRIVSGWMPYWVTSPSRPQGVTAAVQNADLMTEVSPFWYSTTAKSGGGVQVRLNPNFSNGAANVAWAMPQLKAAGLVVVPSIADGSGKGRMAATLADPNLRTTHVNDIVSTVVNGGYDGIDLDYESFAFTDGSSTWPATQPNWTAFIQQLGAALHAQSKLLSVTIPPVCSISSACSPNTGYWVYNLAGIAPSADRIRIMLYDYHVNGIGPISPIGWVRANMQYAATLTAASRLQVGVPTYGRTWTKTNPGGGFKLSGTCPSAGSSAYSSLTTKATINDADIPAFLASIGATGNVKWSDADQENYVEYDKNVQWTDAAGATQTCTAKRIMWFVGPQAVLVRTQLVGELGLSAAAYWTIGGEDPSQWAAVRAYGQSLAPVSTTVTAVGVPSATFGAPVTVTATVTSVGAPVAGFPATLQFRAAGSKAWVDVQAVPTAADGTVTFTVTPTGTGDWQVSVAASGGRAAGTSAPFTTQILSAVTATPTSLTVAKGSSIVVRAVARPAIAGQALALQVQQGAEWKNVARAKANASGRVRLVGDAPASRGRYAYRVVAVGRGSILSGASAPFTVRVTK